MGRAWGYSGAGLPALLGGADHGGGRRIAEMFQQCRLVARSVLNAFQFDVAVAADFLGNRRNFDGDMMASIFGESELWPSWVADMDFKAAQPIQEALARRVEHGIYGYESSSPALPEAVSSWFGKRHGWAFEPDRHASIYLGLAMDALGLPRHSTFHAVRAMVERPANSRAAKYRSIQTRGRRALPAN